MRPYKGDSVYHSMNIAEAASHVKALTLALGVAQILQGVSPGCIRESFAQPPAGDGDHHGFAWRPMMRNSASCVPLQVDIGQACLGQAPVRLGQASSPVQLCTRPMGRQLLSRRRLWWKCGLWCSGHCPGSTPSLIYQVCYHSHTSDGRGHCGNRPRPEQTQL